MKHKQIPLLARHHARPPHNVYDVDSVSAANDALKQAWGPNVIDRVEAQMSAMMKSACLPTAAGFKFSPKPNSLDSGLDKFVISEGYSIGSEIFYAASILEEIGEVRRAKAAGKFDHAVHYAMRFAALVEEANAVVAFGRAPEIGQIILEARAKARESVNAKRKAAAEAQHRRWIIEAKLVWERNPALSVTACARAVINILGLKDKCALRTVRKAIAGKRPQKAGRSG